MPKKCDGKHCVSKKKYDDLLVENRALKGKIKALEMGKLPVKKINSSDSIDSGSSGFDTPNSPQPTSSDFESADPYRSPVFSPVAAKKKRGKKSNKKGKRGRGRGRGKTVKRVKG
jgi:hypothetical protein